jgi:hypothetical protein
MPKGFKKKTIKSTLDDGEVQDILRRILDDAGSIHITYDKYLKYKAECESYLSLLKFIRLVCGDVSLFDIPYNIDINAYISKYEAAIASDFNAPDFRLYIDRSKIDPREQYDLIPQEIKDTFVETYKFIENHSICSKDILSTRVQMSSLQQIFQRLEDKKWVYRDHTTIKDTFITGASDYILAPIESLPQLNFAQMYNYANDSLRPLIVSVLAKIYKCCDDFYNIVMIPNSDPDYFVTIVVTSIEKIQQVLPNCKEAFDKINSSIGLLKENYKDYYVDLKNTDSVAGVIDKFLTDVKNQDEVPLKVAVQFNEIIRYFRKVSKSNGLKNDPIMQKMFKGVTSNLKEVNKIAREHGETVEDLEDLEDLEEDDE